MWTSMQSEICGSLKHPSWPFCIYRVMCRCTAPYWPLIRAPNGWMATVPCRNQYTVPVPGFRRDAVPELFMMHTAIVTHDEALYNHEA